MSFITLRKFVKYFHVEKIIILPINTTGFQRSVVQTAEDRGIPSHYTLLPQYLKNLGYKTHAVGKWHLGHSRKLFLPHNRGFDTHYGYWTGYQDYFDHTIYKDGVRDLDFKFMVFSYLICL